MFSVCRMQIDAYIFLEVITHQRIMFCIKLGSNFILNVASESGRSSFLYTTVKT